MKQAAGIVFVTQDNRVLLLDRADGSGWGIPGGTLEDGETIIQGALRETLEESGRAVSADQIVTLAKVSNADGFEFTAFVCRVDAPFEVIMSDGESRAAKWVTREDASSLPLFMESGKFIAAALDADAVTEDRAPDLNGWFEVPDNPISRVGVFPYLGKNIPGAPDPEGVYMVYRPAEELGSADTIDSIKLTPWVDDHTLIGNTPGAMPAEQKGVHGVIGQDVHFDGRVLYGNLKLFSAAMAQAVTKGKCELSLGYRCKYEYSPGVFEGQEYQYVQRHIRGNHLALVDEGRMGPSVAVIDHFEMAFDAKDVIQMADEKSGAPGADESGGGEITVADVIKQLESLQAMVERLQAAEAPKDDAPTVPEVAPEVVEPVAEIVEDKDVKAELDKEEKPTMANDAAITSRVMAAIAQRDRLAAKLVPLVGAFDHAEMTPAQVVAYGIRKLGVKAPASGHAAFLDGYLSRPVPVAAPVRAVAFDSTDIATAMPAFLAKHIEG